MQQSVALRVVVMGVMLVGLMVPLGMTWELVGERAERRDEAVAEISRTWGSEQTVAAVLLVVPYRSTETHADGRPASYRKGHLVQLPDVLDVSGQVQPERRARGQFSAVVYDTALTIAGRFAPVDTQVLGMADAEMAWDQATVVLGVSDLRGLAPDVRVSWAGQAVPLTPGVPDTGLVASGVHAVPGSIAVQAGAATPFTVHLSLKGTRDLRILPLGATTTLDLTSPWRHPGFVGAPLPASRRVDDAGFSARWQVAHFARAYPSAWTGESIDRERMAAQAAASAFGVSLVDPADVYQQAERAVKYAPLFIVLTLTVAFLWEVTSGRLVHPVQYLFIGFGLCLFYLLLISLAEHVRFDLAYLAAAAGTIGLIAWYWSWVLGGRAHGVVMGLVLSILNTYLYLLLRLEDVALLAGALGLFVMLATVMYMTRRVNWWGQVPLGPAVGSGLDSAG
jgi:inner membrane protein